MFVPTTGNSCSAVMQLTGLHKIDKCWLTIFIGGKIDRILFPFIVDQWIWYRRLTYHQISNQSACNEVNRIVTQLTMDGSIDFNALDLGEVLGEGSFGKLKKARFNNKDVAVKELYTQNPEALKREIKNLMRASHNNIIFLYGVAVNDGVHFLVTDYAEGGSLFNFLHVGQKPDYRLDHAINWSYQCVEVCPHTVTYIYIID